MVLVVVFVYSIIIRVGWGLRQDPRRWEELAVTDPNAFKVRAEDGLTPIAFLCVLILL